MNIFILLFLLIFNASAMEEISDFFIISETKQFDSEEYYNDKVELKKIIEEVYCNINIKTDILRFLTEIHRFNNFESNQVNQQNLKIMAYNELTSEQFFRWRIFKSFNSEKYHLFRELLPIVRTLVAKVSKSILTCKEDFIHLLKIIHEKINSIDKYIINKFVAKTFVGDLSKNDQELMKLTKDFHLLCNNMDEENACYKEAGNFIELQELREQISARVYIGTFFMIIDFADKLYKQIPDKFKH